MTEVDAVTLLVLTVKVALVTVGGETAHVAPPARPRNSTSPSTWNHAGA